jgi:prepilin peptidase CpaA
MPMHALPLCVVLVVVLAAACTDLWMFRIHNLLTVPSFLSGLMYHILVEQVFGLSNSLLGVLIGTLPFVWIYAKGGMGAGDLKLMAVVGVWLGPWFTLHVVIVSGLATGCYAAGLLFWKRTAPAQEVRVPIAGPGRAAQILRETDADVVSVLSRQDRRKHAIPFGAMVAVGVMITALWIGV